MAKRILLFVVFYFVYVSITLAQCDKRYNLLVNNKEQFPSTGLDIVQDHYRIFICGTIELKITNPEPEDVTFKWYRNDSLLQETSSILKSSQGGTFRVEIQTGNCAYKIGNMDLQRIETIPITVSTQELTICDGVPSPVSLWTSVDLSYSDARFQWQKDGKDIPDETFSTIFPNSVGTYALRVSIENCSSTSLPINVKANTENTIRDYLLIDNKSSLPITEDSLFLCKDYTYTFRSTQNTNWYLNGKLIATNYLFTPKESGTYYTRRELDKNCFWGSKPVYVSLDTKLSPLKVYPDEGTTYCDMKTLFFNDQNIKGNNKLTIKNALTGDFVYSLSDFNDFFSIWLTQGKYILNYETGSCKSDPQYFDNSGKKRFISNSNGEKIGGKKITLCPNGSINVWINSSYPSDEVKLFRNGILIQTKPARVNKTISFNLSKSGKYHFEITNPNCTPVTTSLSDTVEIEALESIATGLAISGQTCNSNVLQAKEYAGYTYSWYKNNQLISNQNASTIALKPNDFGNFHAVLQKGFCSVATQIVKIGEKIQGQSTICQYGKIDLRSNIAQATYLWKGPNNFSSNVSNIIIDSVETKHAGLYILQTKKGDCTFIDSIEVKITPKPDLSLTFLNPMCVNNEVLIALKGKAGSYNLHYKFHGILYTSATVQILAGKETNLFNVGVLGNLPQNPQKEFLQLENKGCVFPVAIPKRLSPEECQDILEFVNIKDNYCTNENISLEIRTPKNLSTDVKLNLLLKHPNGYYKLGSFVNNKISIKIPEDIDSYPAFFILESSDGKYQIYSKQITVNNVRPLIFYNYGGYTTDNATHCKGYAIKIDSYNAYYQKFQWKLNGADIPGATSSTFEAKEDGYYTLIATHNGCTAESKGFRLSSGNLPTPVIGSLIGNNAACKGFSVPIRELSSFSYTEYDWRLNGRSIEKQVKNEIIDAKESGYYSLVARQGLCETKSDSIYIEIGSKLNHVIDGFGDGIKQNNKILLCQNASINFISNDYPSESIYYPPGIDFLKKYGLSFQWKFNNENIPGATNTHYSSSLFGRYSLQVKQGDCIANSNEIELVKQNLLNIRFTTQHNGLAIGEPINTITACDKDTVLVYNYPFDSGMNSWKKELYKDGKLLISRTDQASNIWDNSYRLTMPGKYSLKLFPSEQSTCVALSDTLTVKFTDKPLIIPTDTVYSCYNLTTLSAGINGKSYEWFYNEQSVGTSFFHEASQAGLYKLKIKQKETCFVEKDYFIDRKLKPLIQKNGNTIDSTLICTNGEVRLSVGNLLNFNYENESDFIFEWYNNQQKLSSQRFFADINQAGNYFAKVRYKACEASSNMVKIGVYNLKNQILPMADSIGICLKGSFQLLETPEEVGYTYEWFKDNMSLNENSSALKATQAGIYKALIKSGDCSVLTRSIKIYPGTQLPTATISGDTTLNIGDTANLKLSFTSSPPFTYKLSNNQEGTIDKPTIIHPVKIQEATIFKLTSIKNACGEGTVSGEAKVKVIILGNEPIIGHKITIAPVPAENYCEIIIDLPTSQEVSYQLLDMKGQQLSEKNLGNVTSQKQYLNLNQLTAGEYLIRIQVGKDFVTRKLIKL